MKRAILSLLASLFLFCASAQGEYMSHSFVSESTDMFLGGKAVLSIISPHNDLVIEVIPKRPLYSIAKPVAVGNNFRYDIELSIEENATATKREFKVSRYGKTVNERIIETIGENKRKTYKVEEVANPMTVEKNSDRVGLGSTNEEEACVEISSPIKLSVTGGTGLPCTRNETIQSNGTYLISIMVNLVKAEELAQEFFKTIEEYNQLMEKENNGETTDAEFERLNQLEKEILPPLRNKYYDMVTLRLKGDDTNECNIVLGDESGINLSGKERVAYTVLLMKETIYKTEFHQYVEYAVQERSKLKFGNAIKYYKQALAATDKPAGQDEKINAEILACEEYANLNKTGLAMFRQYTELKKQPQVKESEVLTCLEGSLQSFSVLYERSGEELAKTRVQQVSKALEKMPRVIEGVVRTGKLKDGVRREKPVDDCRVYFIDGITNTKVLVGTTDALGRYHVELNRAKIGTLHFEWYNGKKTLSQSIYLGTGNQEHVSWDVFIYNK